jgi:hypothetical protein
MSVCRRSALGSAFLGMSRGLDGVDVEVVRAGMVGIAREHGLEKLHDLRCSRVGLEVQRPELPGAQVHERFRVERRGVEIVGVALVDLAHGRRVREVEIAGLGIRIVRVAFREGGDEVALARRHALDEIRRLADRDARLLELVGQTWDVDVGTERVGDAPPGHRALPIEPRRLGEGGLRLLEVEPVAETDPLIEVLLCAGHVRRDREVVAAEIGEEGRRGAG